MPAHVRLRPITEDDLPHLERLQDREEAGPFGFFGFHDPGRLRREWADRGLLTDDGGRLAVAHGADGRFLGEVQWRRVLQGPASPCWNIGISLLAAERGRGYGTRAQRLLAEYLFAHTRANRVEASTDVANTAEQKALEGAGFTREGVLRGACFRDGAWRDMVMYAVLRSDVPPAPSAGR
ncbi:GNAT family N-acetyltransferase [Nocardiopsis trehalosi]|jgi:RimJ/RimL family protein N-acetyltransferase|uniref:GNAT family N-acetyltransferase n=1 Tax=Nocardiopsis trehalosi TaxID=109329 RepID=UPI000829D2F8|nr:GNAT family protein [Nocardiopsis trehalosi]